MSIDINLLPRSIRDARVRRRAACAWGVVCIVACVASGLWALHSRSQSGDGGRELTRLLGERVKSIESIKQQIARTSSVMATVQKELVVSDHIRARPEWSQLLTLLSSFVGEGAVIEQCRITEAAAPPAVRVVAKPSAKPDPGGAKQQIKTDEGPALAGYVLQLGGAARDQDRVSEIVMAMERSGLFTQTTLVQMRRRSLLRGEAIGFEIRAELAAAMEATP